MEKPELVSVQVGNGRERSRGMRKSTVLLGFKASKKVSMTSVGSELCGSRMGSMGAVGKSHLICVITKILERWWRWWLLAACCCLVLFRLLIQKLEMQTSTS
jgi:hypothetical protein